MIKIVIVMEGGLIQNVLSTEPAEVALIDYDTDGADAKDLLQIPQTGDSVTAYENAFASTRSVEENPILTEQLYKLIEESES